MRFALSLLLLVSLCLALACGDDGPVTPGDDADGGGDAMGDVQDGTAPPFGDDVSWYQMTIVTAAGDTFELAHELDPAQHISFGSTHIAPAVSLAVTHTQIMPSYLVVTVNPGIIVGSTDHPVQCDQAGEYPFGASPPEVQANVQGIQYGSREEGASGAVVVTEWTAVTGQVFAGTFEGRIVQETDKINKLWLDVQGTFHVLLPMPAQGG